MTVCWLHLDYPATSGVKLNDTLVCEPRVVYRNQQTQSPDTSNCLYNICVYKLAHNPILNLQLEGQPSQ